MKFNFSLPRWFWLAVVGVTLMAAFGWGAMKSGPLAPIRVTVARVAVGQVEPALFGIGTVQARRAYLIGPTVAGRVERVRVDVGETVRAGQVLADMDPVDLDARVESSVAAVARARSTVATAQAEVRDAHSRQEIAAIEARRYRDLGKTNFVSQSVVDSKVQQQQSTNAQLAAAESVMVAAKQDLVRLGAERDGVKLQRGNLRLMAPVAGVVTTRDAEPGSTVVAGQSVLKLIDPASLWIHTRIDQSRSIGLREGLSTEITLRSNPRQPLTGKVMRIEPESDSVTEERIVEVALDSRPPGLSTGELAEVTVHLPVVPGVLVIPNAALRYQGTKEGVWLRTDGKLRFVPIKTGAAGLDGMVQVVGDLKSGDEVVVYSERDLVADSRIKVVNALSGGTK